MSGRKFDVLIEDWKYTDPRTGMEIISDETFWVWADTGMKEAFESVEGVRHAFEEQGRYHVYIDKRYDMEQIKREIELICK